MFIGFECNIGGVEVVDMVGDYFGVVVGDGVV